MQIIHVLVFGIFGDRQGAIRYLATQATKFDKCLATMYYPLHAGAVRNHAQNAQIRKAFCTTLKQHSSLPTIVMYNGRIADEFKLCPHVVYKHVELADTKTAKGAAHYKYMRTKFEAWKLMQCKRVLWVDLDTIFVRDPALVFHFCPPTKDMCAVWDQGQAGRPNYFNAGVMVLRPSERTYNRLNHLSMTGPPQVFGDQDTSNELFRGKWHRMPMQCNFMRACCHKRMDWKNVIIVHSKVYDLTPYDRQRILGTDH